MPRKKQILSTNLDSDKFVLRLPNGMRDSIAELAAQGARSMNAEIVRALASWIGHQNRERVDSEKLLEVVTLLREEITRLRETVAFPRAVPQPAKPQHRAESAPPHPLLRPSEPPSPGFQKSWAQSPIPPRPPKLKTDEE